MEKTSFKYSNTLCGSLGDNTLFELNISSNFDYSRSHNFLNYCENCMNSLLDKFHDCMIEEYNKDEDFFNVN